MSKERKIKELFFPSDWSEQNFVGALSLFSPKNYQHSVGTNRNSRSGDWLLQEISFFFQPTHFHILQGIGLKTKVNPAKCHIRPSHYGTTKLENAYSTL